MHLNVQYLLQIFDEIKCILLTSAIDIVGDCETYRNESFVDLNLNVLTKIRKDRGHKKGFGF